jgi:hypothetical protein
MAASTRSQPGACPRPPFDLRLRVFAPTRHFDDDDRDTDRHQCDPKRRRPETGYEQRGAEEHEHNC